MKSFTYLSQRSIKMLKAQNLFRYSSIYLVTDFFDRCYEELSEIHEWVVYQTLQDHKTYFYGRLL